MSRFLIIIFLLPFVFACDKFEENLPDPSVLNKYVEETVVAAAGAVLSTSDTLELMIPAGALPEDGIVFLGRTGFEPTSVPNENLQMAIPPITLRIPSDIILEPFTLSLPLLSYPTIADRLHFYISNGTSYFPVEHQWKDQQIQITIDTVGWQILQDMKGTGVLSEIIIIGLIIKQTPPYDEMGLKEVEIINGSMVFNTPDANPSSRILLLVHGWTGRPAKWDVFLPEILLEPDSPYTDYWTFGYNSSYGIEQNASLLHDLLQSSANGALIDMLAHSMGGLVSRSMIEKYNISLNVDKLITLGTPHQGSPLAAIRNMLGAIVGMEGDNAANIIYDYYSQGFRDLYTNSDYIKQMMKLEAPPVPYYVIACTNEPSALNYISRFVLAGPDDGVVEVASAMGLPGAFTTETNVQILVDLAHLEMTKDDGTYGQVIEILRNTE